MVHNGKTIDIITSETMLVPLLLLCGCFVQATTLRLIILLNILFKVFLSSESWKGLRKNDECLLKITWLFILFLGGVCYVGAVDGIGCAVSLLVVVYDDDYYYWEEWLSPCLTYCFLLTVMSIPMCCYLSRLV